MLWIVKRHIFVFLPYTAGSVERLYQVLWEEKQNSCTNDVTWWKWKFVCPTHSEAKQYRNFGVWSRERFIAGPCKEMGGSCPKSPNSSKGFSKALLKARWGRGVVSCKLLGVEILFSCSCLHRSGHSVPVNLQQNKCYSLFCKFLSLYEWILKGQSPENRLSCIFQAIGNILLQKCRASMTTGNKAQRLKQTEQI